MKTRMISAMLGIALFFVLLLPHPAIFQVAAVIVSGLAIYEIFSVTGLIKKLSMIPALFFGMAFCAVTGCVHLGVLDLKAVYVCLLLFVAYLMTVMVLDHKRVKLNDASIAFFVSIAISLVFSYVIPLRAEVHGALLMVVLFAATWGGDGGAYFVGIKFGKHKLAPVLSPKKTVEGAFGGVLGSVLAMVIVALVYNFILKVPCNEFALILTGVGCSILGPIGDIAMSAIKREYNVKDYGNIMPGHGGVLDRFDSVLLTTPFVYLMHDIFVLIGEITK